MAMISAAVEPQLQLTMEAMTEQTPGHYSEWNRRHQQLLDNDSYLQQHFLRDGGNWSESAAYNANTLVRYQDALWLAVKATSGEIPREDSESWCALAKTVSVDGNFSKTSENPIQNKVVTAEFQRIQQDTEKINRLFPELSEPTEEDSGKVVKINDEGKAVWDEDSGASWQVLFPEFARGGKTTFDNAGNPTTVYDNGYKVMTIFDADQNATEQLYDPDGALIATKTTIFNADGNGSIKETVT